MGTPISNKKPINGQGCLFTGVTDLTEYNISEYNCVFKQQYSIHGNLSEDIKGNDRPQHWSISRISVKCSEHNAFVKDYNIAQNNPYIEIQSSCIGHKLKTGNLRGQELPIVKSGNPITNEEIKQIVDVLKYQIAERAKSPKYQVKLIHTEDLPKFNISDNNNETDNIANKKISYANCMYKLLRCINKLQRKDTDEYHFSLADSYPNQVPDVDGGISRDSNGNPNRVLSPTEAGIANDRHKQINSKSTRKIDTPSLSKANIEAIVQTIKNDLNDCICYGDCNGYSVCFCYGNCNHY